MEKISILTTPIDFDKSDYLSLLSLSAGTAIARQNKMGEFVIKDNGWNVDIKNREISFGNAKYLCGIIGSESYQSNTWLWGWANTESKMPEIVFAPGRRAKRAIPDCQEFTVEKFGLDEIHTGHNLSMITIGVSEKNVGYYRCPYEGGALFVQIEGLPAEVFAPLSLVDVVRQYMEIISAFYCDHRLLLAGMLHQNGLGFNCGNGFITCESQGRTLRIDFEDLGGIYRTANVSLN